VRICFVTPPPLKPSEPGISAPSAADLLRRIGANARSIDASIGWHRFVLARDRLGDNLAALTAEADAGEREALERAVRSVTAEPAPLKRPETYASRDVYTSAIDNFEKALRAVASPFPGVRLGVAMFALEAPPRRLESSACLADLARTPGPFDAYFEAELIPRLRAAELTHVGVSLTFQQQAPAAFRLARLLARHLPEASLVLGGPLVACWAAIGVAFDRPPFDAFHSVLAGGDRDLARLAGDVSADEVTAAQVRGGPLAAALDEAEWEDYLVPVPTVPAALGRGCYWRRCTFCPDHLHARHRACSTDALEAWLRAVAERFPDGAMLHLTDSALPPSHLRRVASIIERDQLPIRWHGFVRVERRFAEAQFAERLARGGCAMLQFGVETGSPRLIEQMGKGSDPDLAKRVLTTCAAAGIRNHVYLLFGLPGETDTDRDMTLELIEGVASAIHAINPALLNLPKRSPMHSDPGRYGITELLPFGEETDLSLYDDFRCGPSHPRLEARRWLGQRFFKSEAVRTIGGRLRSPFKANHLCFL
jgi:hypothetical protein